jgi:hypothetical protein
MLPDGTVREFWGFVIDAALESLKEPEIPNEAER